MTGETPAPAEQSNTAEFNARLHGSLSALLAQAPFQNDAYKILLGEDEAIEVSDYFSYEHHNAQEFRGDTPARRQTLQDGTAILSLKSSNPKYAEMNQLILFRPCDIDPHGMTAAVMRDRGHITDFSSSDYVLWHLRQGIVEEPISLSLIQDLRV